MNINIPNRMSKNAFTPKEADCLRFLQNKLHIKMLDLKVSATTEARIQKALKLGLIDSSDADKCRYCSRVILSWLTGHSRFFIRYINKYLGGILYQKNTHTSKTGQFDTEPVETAEDYLAIILLDALTILYNYDLEHSTKPLTYITNTLVKRSSRYMAICSSRQSYGNGGLIEDTFADETSSLEDWELAEEKQQLEQTRDAILSIWEIIVNTYDLDYKEAQKLAVKFYAPSARQSLNIKPTTQYIKTALWVGMLTSFNELFTYPCSSSSLALPPDSPCASGLNSSLAYLTLLRLQDFFG